MRNDTRSSWLMTVCSLSAFSLLLMGCDGGVSADKMEMESEAPGEEVSLIERVKEAIVGRTYTLPAGTQVFLRLDHGISTKSNKSGDTFKATLDQDLEVDGKVVALTGSEVAGVLTHVDDGGRVQGRATMSLKLDSLRVDDKQYTLQTNPITIQAESTQKKDAAVIGGSSAVGAIIGAVAGGKKGAAIGAGVGAGAGTGVVLTTKGKQVEFGPETRFAFTLSEPVDLPEAEQ